MGDGEQADEQQEPRGKILWRPNQALLDSCQLTRFLAWLQEERAATLSPSGQQPIQVADIEPGDYAALHQWSVRQLSTFWQSVAEFYRVRWHSAYQQILEPRSVWGAHWFVEGTLNYAEHALNPSTRVAEKLTDDDLAIIARAEGGRRATLSYGQLRDRVARVRAGLQRLGVGPGDRVVGFLPNAPEAIVSFLAVASLGAVWSSCPPEFGVESVLDRFKQISPKVLLGVSGYHYGGKFRDRSDELRRILEGLPSLEACVIVPHADQDAALLRSVVSQAAGDGRKSLGFDELSAEHRPLTFEAVPFEHPLWILYSSGTTGLPKAIVHGHGGILLEHLKQLGLQSDIGFGDRFFWFSTTGWMMWNYLVSGLCLGATLVLYDGNPGYPDLGALWQMAAEEKVTYFGTSAPFLLACRKAQLEPGKSWDLSSLRAVGSTGAPLPGEGFDWVYDQVGRDLLLGSVSGGTDLCTAFLGSCPWLAVRRGELQCRSLGARVEAYDEAGHCVVDQVGELVITEPMPSMPVHFWNDDDGARYRASYFEQFPGIWRHGDWIRITSDGAAVVYGRSDSTLNRGGVRMGTSEFYRVVDRFDEVIDSLVVDTSSLDRPGKLWLFLVLGAEHILGPELIDRLKVALRAQLSPRHVPDEFRQISEVPRTLSGKKLEVPIKRILDGVPVAKAVNPGTLKNAQALYELLDVLGVARDP